MRATRVIVRHELRDLWVAGRGLPLMLAYTLMLSVATYLVATNQELALMEQRESLGLVLQLAVAVSALLVLLVAADAISGERERGTLESMLLTPAPRTAVIAGKAVAALSLWLVAYLLTVPYLVFLARGTGMREESLAAGAAVGLLVALFLAGLGLAVSAVTRSNRVSMAVCLFVLLAAFFPTRLPTGTRQSWFGDLLYRYDPITAGLHYLNEVVVTGHRLTADLRWLLGPAVMAAVALAVALAVGARMRLLSGAHQ